VCYRSCQTSFYCEWKAFKAKILTWTIALWRAKSATHSLNKSIARLIDSFVLRERHDWCM
jgi:hypothetical protein